VSDVVQKGGHPDRDAVLLERDRQLANFVESGDGSPGQVVRAESVLEPGVSGAGVHQVAVADLTDVPEALNCGCVEGAEGGSVEPDVVPEGIADDFRGS